MQRIPSKALIDRTVAGYFRYITWYIHVLPRSTYQSHEDAVLSAKAAEKPAPPISLVICFVVWALGLYGSDESGPTYSKYSQTDLSVKLVELSRNALAIGRFLETPSVCSIRALLLLAVHYAVLAPGEDGGRGIGLLALAIQGCLQVRLLSFPLLLFTLTSPPRNLQLDLHRDPEKRRPDLTFAEKEDRRRVFWTTRLKDAEVASVSTSSFSLVLRQWMMLTPLHFPVGRRFTLIRARDCDTKLPLDIDDDKLDELDFQPTREDTSMSASLVRMRIAHLTEQIVSLHSLPYLPSRLPSFLPFFRLRRSSGTAELPSFHSRSAADSIYFVGYTPSPTLALSSSTARSLSSRKTCRRSSSSTRRTTRSLSQRLRLSSSTYARCCTPSSHLPVTDSLPPVSQLAILQERLRLHRPYLSRAFVDSKYKYSRDVCVNTAKQVLSLQTHPALNSGWACMTFKAIVASVVLLVVLMYDPGNEGAEAWKGMIRETISRLSVYKNISVRPPLSLTRLDLLSSIDLRSSDRPSAAAGRSSWASFCRSSRRTSASASTTKTVLSPSESARLSTRPVRRHKGACLMSAGSTSTLAERRSTSDFELSPSGRAAKEASIRPPFARSSPCLALTLARPSVRLPRRASSRPSPSAGAAISAIPLLRTPSPLSPALPLPLLPSR